MARIRTIKPQLARHRVLFDLERDTGVPFRFVWAMFPTVCDREGRFYWRPWELRLDILPYDHHVDFSWVMDHLQFHGFLHRYTHDGEEYGCIPTFKKHQVVNTREKSSELPDPAQCTMHVPKDQSRHNVSAVRRQCFSHALACAECGTRERLQFYPLVATQNTGNVDLSNIQLLCLTCSEQKPELLAITTAYAEHAKSIVTRMPGQCFSHGEGKGREGNMEVEGIRLNLRSSGDRPAPAEPANPPRGDAPAKTNKEPKPDRIGQAIVAAYCQEYRKRWNTAVRLLDADAKKLKRVAESVGLERAVQLVQGYMAMKEPWFETKKHDVQTFVQALNQVQVFVDTGQGNKGNGYDWSKVRLD